MFPNDPFNRVSAQACATDRRKHRVAAAPASIWASQAFEASRLSVRSGVTRSLRPLPMHLRCAPVPSSTSPTRRPITSDTRKPV